MPVPSWPAPSEPGLLPCSPARLLPRASVWRSHSALTTRLAGSGSREIEPWSAVRLLRALLPRPPGLCGPRPPGASLAGGGLACTPCCASLQSARVPGGASDTMRPGDAWHGARAHN